MLPPDNCGDDALNFVHDHIEELERQSQADKATIEKLTEALEFYADVNNYQIEGVSQVLGCVQVHLGKAFIDEGNLAANVLKEVKG